MAENYESKWGNRLADPSKMEGAAPYPLWMTAQQADRIVALMEAAGFTNIKLEQIDAGSQLAVYAEDDGFSHTVRVGESNLLTSIVWQFKQWRKRRHG